MIQKTKYDSYCLNDISKGCKYCVHGKKLVLFISGLCSRNCFYCPLSEKRKNKDIAWANERKLSKNLNLAIKEAIEEAKICGSEGMGITGGDPLLSLQRTIRFIKKFKKNFGKSFHTHIYLIPETANGKNLRQLQKAGVDEVRFHPTILANKPLEKEMNIIKIASGLKWGVGIEIPVIPRMEKKILDIINKIRGHISFVNLNELEVSDINLRLFEKFNLKIDKKDPTGYVIKGSKKSALKILKYCAKNYPELLIHFCSARTKNIFQYKQRLIIRAKHAKTKFDKITKYGDLDRNIIYLNNFYPSFGYENKIENICNKKKKKLMQEIIKNKKKLVKFGIDEKEIIIDGVNLRFITSRKVLEKFSEQIKSLKLKPALVEELPTYYSLPLEVNFL